MIAAGLVLWLLPGSFAPRLMRVETTGIREWTLAWDPVTETADEVLASYRVYVGTASGAYTQQFVAGTATMFTVILPDGPVYYFAVTAWDTKGKESGFSNEVNTEGQRTRPPTATNLAPKP